MFQNNLLMAAASISTDAAYTVDNSCRFDRATPSYLTYTPGSTGDRRQVTLSFWQKLANVGKAQVVTFSNIGSSYFQFGNPSVTDTFLDMFSAGSGRFITTQLFRDPSAWFHIVFSFDTEQVIGTDRMKMYVNGKIVTDYSTYTALSLDTDLDFTNTIVQRWGIYGTSASLAADCYLSQVCMIDGLALGPTSFGEFDDNGVWRPIDITGLTFGTTGYLLDFADSSALGNDVSGNDNDFASTGLAAVDQVSDTPTKNYPTFASNMGRYVTSAGDASTLSNGNLDIVGAESAVSICDVNFVPLNTGKWYFTWLHDARNNMNNDMGITNEDNRSGKNGALSGGYIGAIGCVLVGLEGANQMSVQSADFTNIDVTFPVTSTTSDQTVMAVDIDNLKLWAGFWDQSEDDLYWLANDGSWSSANVDVPATGSSETCAITGTGLTFFSQNYGTRGGSVDFGSINGGILANITTPSGFKQLNTANLPEPTVKNGKKYFDTILYQGNGTAQKVGQFQPMTETYSVGNSALVVRADGTELRKTWGTAASSTKDGTFSCWFKIANNTGSAGGYIITCGGGGKDFIKINTSDNIHIQLNNESNGLWTSGEKIEDTTQWTNLVVAYDLDNSGGDADRLRTYLNGVEITANGTFGSTIDDLAFSMNQNSVACAIGGVGTASADYMYAGYLAEVVWCDGQVLTPSSFGEVDSTTNRWIPKDVSGLTFGNNGFYFDFADENALGDDESGNGNDWTTTGFDTTNGSNQFYDTPTDNFAIMGDLANSAVIPGAGRLSIISSGSGYFPILGSIPMYDGTGKWVWETRLEAEDANPYGMWGVCNVDAVLTGTGFTGSFTTWAGYNAGNGEVTNITPAPTEPAINDIVRFEYDSDTRQIAIINVTSTGAGYQVAKQSIQIEGNPIYPFVAPYGVSLRARFPMNFGQQNYVFGAATTLDSDAGGYFNSTPTEGYKALKADNLTESDSFISAFSWIKNRETTDAHMLFDRVRGPYSFWNSDDDANIADDVDTLTRFLKQGVNISDDVRVNTFDEGYALWDWFIETAGSGASNEDGTINTTATLVDTTGGISISKFTGTGANATVGHGLGVAPKFLIIKHFDNSSYSTPAWHNKLPTPTTALFYFDNSDAKSAAATAWNSTIPTSTVVSLGSGASTNNSSTAYMMYCFAEIKGFSRFGAYEGNGDANGTYVYTGFKPAYVMIKKSSGTGNWVINDSARSPFNEIDDQLLGNTTTAETTGSEEIDFLGNGFKIRGPDSDTNSSAGFYVYMAFAEYPFGGASTTPSTAF